MVSDEDAKLIVDLLKMMSVVVSPDDAKAHFDCVRETDRSKRFDSAAKKIALRVELFDINSSAKEGEHESQ